MDRNVKPLFEYLDYREYMKDNYCSTKEAHPFISFRYIEAKTGIDASYYAKVINRQKHISETSIPALAQFFRFNKRETDYFTTLVSFCKARKNEQIEYYFDRLIILRDPGSRRLEEKKYKYFQQWYTVVIRELLHAIDYRGDYQELAARLEPPISAVQARQSIKLLDDLGLVRTDSSGRYFITDQFLTTDQKLRSIAVREFQRSMIRLAGEALDRFRQGERDISSLTISTSPACMALIREKLDRTRKEILQIVAEHEDDPCDVYQLNFQVFPVTRDPKCARETGGR